MDVNKLFIVNDAFGNRSVHNTQEEARSQCEAIMAGYVEGRTCASDPQPTVTEVTTRLAERHFFNQHMNGGEADYICYLTA